MAIRTKVDSIPKATERTGNLTQLNTDLQSLRARYPGAAIERYLDKVPTVAPSASISTNACVIGDVRLSDEVSIWYGCVLRGDVNYIEIRERSNVQDLSCIHLGDDDPTFIGEDVVVGHRAVLHGCRVGAGTLIGIQSTILDGAVIGEGSIIGSCALVTAGVTIPPRSLVLGSPGKVVKTLTASDEVFHRALAGKYTRLAHNYKNG